jgi:hypothetical protein
VADAMRLLAAAVLLAVLPALAGCASKAPAAVAPTAAQGFLDGVVVTSAIVPIAGAAVTLDGVALNATSDKAGAFRIGPLEPGSYQVHAAAPGYAPAVTTAEVKASVPNRVNVVLQAVSLDVAYSQTMKFDAYIECSYGGQAGGVPLGGFPCIGIIDLTTGQHFSTDVWRFRFDISAPGFKGLVVEETAVEQPTSHIISFNLRDPEGLGGGTGAAKQYAGMSTDSPLKEWVYPGIENPGSYKGDVFYPVPNATVPLELLVGNDADWSQPASVQVMLQAKPQVFVTLFYNALPGEDFSVFDQK